MTMFLMFETHQVFAVFGWLYMVSSTGLHATCTAMRVSQEFLGTREQMEKSKGTRRYEPVLGNGRTRTTGRELRASGVGGKQICKRE